MLLFSWEQAHATSFEFALTTEVTKSFSDIRQHFVKDLRVREDFIFMTLYTITLGLKTI